MYDHLLIDEAAEYRSSMNENYMSDCLKFKGAQLSCMYNGLKMALLVGFLTFQGSQQAIADTGGMQPLSYFGDLGDINTGFLADLFL